MLATFDRLAVMEVGRENPQTALADCAKMFHRLGVGEVSRALLTVKLAELRDDEDLLARDRRGK